MNNNKPEEKPLYIYGFYIPAKWEGANLIYPAHMSPISGQPSPEYQPQNTPQSIKQ